jgi:tetratricopeptide (TPR) repeat protein
MSIREQLEEAYELIQQEQLDEATAFLKPILDDNPDNADAWWLMANAVSEPRDARRALVNVLKNNPRHTKAREMLDKLNELYPPRDDELMMMLEIPEIEDDPFGRAPKTSDDDLLNLFDSDADIDLDDLDDLDSLDDLDGLDDDDPFAELLSDEKPATRSAPRQKSGGRGRRILTPLLIIVVAALIATVLIALQGGADGDVDSGQADVDALSPHEPDTQLVAYVSSADNIAKQQFGNDSSAMLASSGDDDPTQTLYVDTCICMTSTCTGKKPSELSSVVLEAFVVATTNLDPTAGISRIGVNVKACSGTDIVYRTSTSIDAYQDYLTTGNLEAFRQAWEVEG